jgi:hypothetical protein
MNALICYSLLLSWWYEVQVLASSTVFYNSVFSATSTSLFVLALLSKKSMDDSVMSLLKATAPLTVGTELAALLSGKLHGAAAGQAAARLLRLATVLGAVGAARKLAGSSSPGMIAAVASGAAAAAQLQTSCFHWTGAVYIALRAAGVPPPPSPPPPNTHHPLFPFFLLFFLSLPFRDLTLYARRAADERHWKGRSSGARVNAVYFSVLLCTQLLDGAPKRPD